MNLRNNMKNNNTINNNAFNINIINAKEQKYMKTTTLTCLGYSYEIKHKKHKNITNPFIVYPSICFYIVDKKLKNKNLYKLFCDIIIIVVSLSFTLLFVSYLIGGTMMLSGFLECSDGDCSYIFDTYNDGNPIDECNKYLENKDIFEKEYRGCFYDAITHSKIISNTLYVGFITFHKYLFYAFIVYMFIVVIITILGIMYNYIARNASEEMQDIVESIV